MSLIFCGFGEDKMRNRLSLSFLLTLAVAGRFLVSGGLGKGVASSVCVTNSRPTELLLRAEVEGVGLDGRDDMGRVEGLCCGVRNACAVCGRWRAAAVGVGGVLKLCW